MSKRPSSSSIIDDNTRPRKRARRAVRRYTPTTASTSVTRDRNAGYKSQIANRKRLTQKRAEASHRAKRIREEYGNIAEDEPPRQRRRIIEDDEETEFYENDDANTSSVSLAPSIELEPDSPPVCALIHVDGSISFFDDDEAADKFFNS